MRMNGQSEILTLKVSTKAVHPDKDGSRCTRQNSGNENVRVYNAARRKRAMFNSNFTHTKTSIHTQKNKSKRPSKKKQSRETVSTMNAPNHLIDNT